MCWLCKGPEFPGAAVKVIPVPESAGTNGKKGGIMMKRKFLTGAALFTCCACTVSLLLAIAVTPAQAVPVVVQNRNPADLSVVGLIGPGTPTSGTSTLNDITSAAGIEYNNLGFRTGIPTGESDPDNWLYALQLTAAGNSGIIGIDPATGNVSVVDSIVADLPNRRIASGDVGGAGDNTMYLADDEGISSDQKELFIVDLSSVINGGSTELTATKKTITGGTGTVFDYAWYDGYLWGGDQDQGQLARLDPTSGNRTDFNVTGLPSGVAFGAAWYNTDEGGDSVYLYRNSPDSNGDSIFRIDDLSGTPTIGATWAPPSATALVYNDGTYVPREVELVPIPAAAWLFGSGLIALVAIRRRTRKD